MLGEKIFEWTGTVRGERVLPADADIPKMEITFAGQVQGYGRLAGFTGMGTGTYEATARPDGTFAGEGNGIVMSETEGFSAKGLGVGRLSGGKFSYRGALTFRSGSPNLGWLNGTFGVFEYEQDISSGEVTFICYEWK